MKVDDPQFESGFTLIELIAVLVILGVLAVYATSKCINLYDDAKAAAVNEVFVALQSGEALVKASYLIQGSPGASENQNVEVTIAGIPVRFRQGTIKNTENSDHVPTVPQSKNKNYTRLFFYF